MCRDPDSMAHVEMDGAVDRGGGKREMVAVGGFRSRRRVFGVDSVGDGGALIVVVVVIVCCCYNTPSNLFYSIFPS